MRVVTSPLPRYGIAVVTTAGAALFALLLSPLSLRVPFTLFAVAVLVSSLEGGLKPGLLATALSTAALAVEFWLLPLAQLPENHGEVVPLLILFVIVALGSSYLGEQCWRAVHAVESDRASRPSLGDRALFTAADEDEHFKNSTAHAATDSYPEGAADRVQRDVDRSAHAASRHPAAQPIVRPLRKGSTAVVAEPSANGQTAPIRARKGGVRGAMLCLREVRAVRQVESELQQREQQFRSLAACAPAGILQMDLECRCVYTNCSCQLMGGFSAEEVQGDGWARFLHPEDRARIVPAWIAAMQAGKEFACELRFHSPPPWGRWVQLRSSPMVCDLGKLIGHVAVVQDIDTQKRAEEALRETRTLLSTVVAESADALFVQNLEDRYVLTNSAGARMLGKSIQEIIGNDESHCFARAGDDGQHDYHVRKIPVQDESGNLLGQIGICREAAEEKRLQAELAKARAALEREMRARQHAEELLRQCRVPLPFRAEQTIEPVEASMTRI